MALEQAFSQAILVSPVNVILSMLRIHSFIYHRRHIISSIAGYLQ